MVVVIHPALLREKNGTIQIIQNIMICARILSCPLSPPNSSLTIHTNNTIIRLSTIFHHHTFPVTKSSMTASISTLDDQV